MLKQISIKELLLKTAKNILKELISLNAAKVFNLQPRILNLKYF
jgi:hypothetical protein